MIYHGYDTDELTNRQNYVFRKLLELEKAGVKGVGSPLRFIIFSIRLNYSCGCWNNYDGDCEYLEKLNQETLKKYGLDLDTLYK